MKQIREKIVGSYVKHYLMPRVQVIDKPGFVFFNFSKADFFSRQLVMPELFFVHLEKRVRELKGEQGKRMLYSAGKKFGYRFGVMGDFSKRGQIQDGKIEEYVKTINKFIEGTYAKDISCKIDLKKLEVQYALKDFVVAGRLGEGYFLPLGTLTGLMAYLLNDESIEGAHLGKCSVEGDCNLVYTRGRDLGKYVKGGVFAEQDLKGLDYEEDYEAMNSLRSIENSRRSFQNLIDSGMFSLKEGEIMNNKERYFICEASGMYLLELELGKDKKTLSVLGEVAYETGKEIIENTERELGVRGVVDLLSAFGWGDPAVFHRGGKYVFDIKYFPWTKFADKAGFVAFGGLLAGMLSAVVRREVKFGRIEKDVSEGHLNLVFSE